MKKFETTFNSKNEFVKLLTNRDLTFSEVKGIAKEFNLVLTDYNDFLTLTKPGTKEGLMVSNVGEPSTFNQWVLYSNYNGITKDVFTDMQQVFKYLNK